ncbi:MAG TPA: FAD-dependent oxidoreductase [Candidatus Saccharimonadales bacterium]|nr:FAD-dependent oxidoreductase [Candidatus Saccharimonadales bacterium]
MQITIVGGGFGGIRAALKLAREKSNEITLISDRPEFQYYPTLYSSATGHSHLESWVPLGEIFAEHENVKVHIDTIETLQVSDKTLRGKSGATYKYDTLILAMGVVTTYFGIPGLETYAYGIKSEAEIKHLKQRLYTDIAENHELDRNYVVIGAGPTGVELSAALGTYIQRLSKKYRVKGRGPRVRLIEASPRVLPRMSELSSRVVEHRLRSLGVDVETGKKVEGENATELVVSGKPIASHTVIWTSGVTNNPFFAAHPNVFKLAKNGRVEVDAYLKAYNSIYVIGDNAATPYTGLAQTAIHDGDFVAKNLIRKSHGKKVKKYHTSKPIPVVPVGANWAAVEWRGIKVYGFIGGLIRRAADAIGYNDLLPLGRTIGAWTASMVYEEDYFTPTVKDKKLR